jgi:hypothetical protein
MKTLYRISLALALCFLFACTESIKEDKVPSAVTGTFHATFPGATHVTWSLETDTCYEAEFTNAGKESSMLISNIGNWIETETMLGSSELPITVIQTIEGGFKGFRIKHPELIETPSQGKFYEMVIKSKREAFEIQLSESGVILKKEVYKGKRD